MIKAIYLFDFTLQKNHVKTPTAAVNINTSKQLPKTEPSIKSKIAEHKNESII